MKHSAPLQRGSMAWLRKPRKPLAAVSPRKTLEKPQRDAVRAAVLERDGGCSFPHDQVPGLDCAGPLDCHEIIPRSAWPGGYLEPANCRIVCRRSHDWIGENIVRAHNLGLHGFSYERFPYPGSRP